MDKYKEQAVDGLLGHLRSTKAVWPSVAIVAVAVSALVGWLVWYATKNFYAERFEAQQVQITALKDDVARLADRQTRAKVGPVGAHHSESAPAGGDLAEPAPTSEQPTKQAGASRPRPAAIVAPKEPPKEGRTVPHEDPRPGVPPGGISAPNSVVSVNQQGGITTGSFNVNMPNPPKLTVPQGDVIKAALARVTAPATEVAVGCAMSDNDSCYVAEQIATVLGQAGWRRAVALLPVRVTGVVVEADGALPAVQALRDGLQAAGLPVSLRQRPGNILVIVGPRP